MFWMYRTVYTSIFRYCIKIVEQFAMVHNSRILLNPGLYTGYWYNFSEEDNKDTVHY